MFGTDSVIDNSSTTEDPNNGPKHSANLGADVGGGLSGGIVGVILLLCFFFYYRGRRNKTRYENDENDEPRMGDDDQPTGTIQPYFIESTNTLPPIITPQPNYGLTRNTTHANLRDEVTSLPKLSSPTSNPSRNVHPGTVLTVTPAISSSQELEAGRRVLEQDMKNLQNETRTSHDESTNQIIGPVNTEPGRGQTEVSQLREQIHLIQQRVHALSQSDWTPRISNENEHPPAYSGV